MTGRPRSVLTWYPRTVHRTALRMWLAYVALCAALLAALHFSGVRIAAAREACASEDAGCTAEVAAQTEVYGFLLGLAQNSLTFLPLVVAAFAGAALVGRELESGTAALAWTQSLHPVRWLAAKLVLPAVVLACGTLSLTVLVRWARQPETVPPWSAPTSFVTTGPTATAWVLFALVAGAVSGLLLRRVLPALALAVAGTGVALFLGASHRVDLWPKEFRSGLGKETPAHAQILETGGVTASGERFSWDRCFTAGQRDAVITDCLAKYDAEPYTLFHPAAHYWPLQWVETGVVLGLATVLTVAAFQLVRHRAAAHRQEDAA